MKVRSYYLTKKSIVVKCYDGKTTILELNRMNLLKVIDSLNEQIDYDVEDVIKKEDDAYRKLVTIVGVFTLIELFLAYVVFIGFTRASYVGILAGIILSILLLITSLVYTVIGFIKIRGYKYQYKVYEGREILLDKYNNLVEANYAELVDVY